MAQIDDRTAEAPQRLDDQSAEAMTQRFGDKSAKAIPHMDHRPVEMLPRLDKSSETMPTDEAMLSVERRVQYRIIARSPRGENEVAMTLAADQPLERLMAAWCSHHGLARTAARFTVAGAALSSMDTALKLAGKGVIPHAALPAVEGEEGTNVTVRAIPRRRPATPS